LFVLVAFTPLPDLLNTWTLTPAKIEPAEAIVVLGGYVRANGALADASLRRAIEGMILHKKGLAPLVAFSGPANGVGIVEAEVRAAMARVFGIPATVILTEPLARTTREEAIRMAALLQPLGVRRILLVTDMPHMARSQRLFENVGFVVHAAPVDARSWAESPEGGMILMRQVTQEILARLYYRVAGYL
jgi:uncharacterized SAM-binding protein YcdF (DUF218 family)